MEINNIWSALSSENIAIINLMKYIGMFIESYLLLKLSLSALNVNSSKKQRILYVLLLGLEGIISSYIIPSPLNLITNYFINFLLVLFIFKIKPLKVILFIMK